MPVWVTPKTWEAVVVTVADMNQVRDELLYLYDHRLGSYPATLANSNGTTETTICSFVVPANDWLDGDVFFVWMTSLNKNNKGTSGTPLVKVNVGAGAQVNVFGSVWANNASEYKSSGFACALTRVGNDVWVTEPGIGILPAHLTNIAGGAFAHGVTTTPGISTPTNFTGANTVSLKCTLDANDATYYTKPQKARVWRVPA